MENMEERKIGYIMIMNIDRDISSHLSNCLNIGDIPSILLQKAKERDNNITNISKILEQLDLGDYIEIINLNKEKIGMNVNELSFINKVLLSNIVPIRNRIMHPKPLEFNDFAILENLYFKIDVHIQSIAWTCVVGSRENIRTNPQQVIFEYDKRKEIIDNVPDLNCEEIDFIGRKKEISELKASLLSRKKSIISIVAAGGYGKTALALKVLNDFKKEKNCPFDIICWVSFKTKQLDKTSFIDVKESVDSVVKMKELFKAFAGSSSDNVFSDLIELAKNFKMLLVLDNLETISIDEIIDFISEFSNYGKILITSRLSLGQLDLRFDLGPLNENDLLEFSNKLLGYYNLDQRYSNEEIIDISKNVLFSNPLSIKWAIRSLFNGLSLEKIKEERNDVVHFCMDNVYDKISEDGKKILRLLSYLGKPLTRGQIYYYLQTSEKDIPSIADALEQLNRACFIDKLLVKKGLYSIIEQGKIFIDGKSDYMELIHDFSDKKKQISSFPQTIENNPQYNKPVPKSIKLINKDDDTVISAWYLTQAVKESGKNNLEKSLLYVAMAEQICPKYFETYKIHGLILGEYEDLEGYKMFDKALNCCSTDCEKSLVFNAYSFYFSRMGDFNNACLYIDKAIQINADYQFLLNKVKILMYLGKYELANKLLNQVPFEVIDDDLKCLYTGLKAEIIRRNCEKLTSKSSLGKKVETLYEAFSIICDSKYNDDYSLNIMCKIFDDSLHVPQFNDCHNAMLSKLLDQYNSISKLREFSELKKTLLQCMSKFKSNISNAAFKKIFKLDISKLNKKTIGVVSFCSENAAFIVNQFFKDGIYFYPNVEIRKGVIVEFEIQKNKAINVREISKI